MKKKSLLRIKKEILDVIKSGKKKTLKKKEICLKRKSKNFKKNF